MDNQWQDNLRSRMESHEESVPDRLWEGIERHMITEKFDNKKHRLWVISLTTVAAVAVILLFIVFNISDNSKVSIEYTDNTVSKISEPANSIVGVNTETVLSEILTLNNQNDEIAITDNIEGDVTDKKITLIDSEPIQSTIIIQSTESLKDVTKELLEEEGFKESSQEENNLILDSKNEQLFASETGINIQKKSRWQTNVSISNAPLGSTETYAGYGTFALEEVVGQQYAFNSQYTREEAYTDVNHQQPITFGLTLKYNLSDRWSMASGLTYSLLSSQLRSESKNYFYDDTQTLHYLGVPLNVAYSFWQNNKISTYFSVGGLVEKNITGNLKSNYYIDNELEVSTNKRVTSRELQWSVNSALGIEYQISDKIGLYAEPGVVYYFNNYSELETIYKDRPTNFNLRLGLRFTFMD